MNKTGGSQGVLVAESSDGRAQGAIPCALRSSLQALVGRRIRWTDTYKVNDVKPMLAALFPSLLQERFSSRRASWCGVADAQIQGPPESSGGVGGQRS